MDVAQKICKKDFYTTAFYLVFIFVITVPHWFKITCKIMCIPTFGVSSLTSNARSSS